MFMAPVTEMFAVAVNNTAVPAPMLLVREPEMVNAVAGIVFVTAPEEAVKTRLP